MPRKKTNIIRINFRRKKKTKGFSIGANIKMPVDTSKNADIIHVDFRNIIKYSDIEYIITVGNE